MGEVWRARDTRLGRDVAVKLLPASCTSQPEPLRRFELEARATAALSHPSILAVFDVGTCDGQPYIVEELLEGESLRALLQRGPLPVGRAVELAVQAAQGLALAHEKGIVHRDLKPENLFVTRGGHLKILDFGLAKLTCPEVAMADDSTLETRPPGTAEGRLLGTIAYMAPEQVRGQPCDHRTDVFALGCVVFEMLSGHRPFPGQTTADVMSAILLKSPPPLSGPGREIPPALEGLVGRCLEKSPGDRFQSTQDLAFGLATLSRLLGAGSGSSESVPAPPPAPSPRPAPARPGRRRLLLAGVALLALAGAVLGGAWLQRRPADPPAVRATRLTFRRGQVCGARFGPDGTTAVYSASWDGAPAELFSVRLGSPEPTPLGYAGFELLAVSPLGELALLRNPVSPLPFVSAAGLGRAVTLATAPLTGGTPKDVDGAARVADYSPDGRALAVARLGEAMGIEYPLGSTPRKVEVAASGSDALRVSRDGREVAFFTGRDIRLLAAGGRVEVLAPDPGWVRGLAWSPGGGEVWWSAGNELRARARGGRQRLVYTSLAPLRLHDVAGDGRVLVSALERRVRWFFRGEDGSPDRELSWLDWTNVSDLSADGRRIAFHESEFGVGFRSVVYLRETTGEPPMRLGEGANPRISPDGSAVVAARRSNAPPGSEVVVYPVGPGPARRVPLAGFAVEMAGLLPDGDTVWFTGAELPAAGAARPEGAASSRLWLTDLRGSRPRPVTPEGVPVPGEQFTPDGKHVVVLWQGRLALLPLAGGEPRPLPGLEADDGIAGFAADGESIFVFRSLEDPIPVFRVDLGTGRRRRVREIVPADRSGVGGSGRVFASADGSRLVYGHVQRFSELYLVEGLR